MSIWNTADYSDKYHEYNEIFRNTDLSTTWDSFEKKIEKELSKLRAASDNDAKTLIRTQREYLQKAQQGINFRINLIHTANGVTSFLAKQIVDHKGNELYQLDRRIREQYARINEPFSPNNVTLSQDEKQELKHIFILCIVDSFIRNINSADYLLPDEKESFFTDLQSLIDWYYSDQFFSTLFHKTYEPEKITIFFQTEFGKTKNICKKCGNIRTSAIRHCLFCDAVYEENT